ncbi:MAG TPA: hypothetical protein EYP09_06660 [Anaerolineae bacterium]|nr:hypothetical protein [Anaerolineae bacterium]
MKALKTAGLILAYLILVIASNIGLKLSALSQELRGFLWWQAVGNALGFLGVLTLTLLLRLMPLHLAYALTYGLSFVGVQVVGARLFFREAIAPVQWLGIAFIAVGIVIVSLGR